MVKAVSVVGDMSAMVNIEKILAFQESHRHAICRIKYSCLNGTIPQDVVLRLRILVPVRITTPFNTITLAASHETCAPTKTQPMVTVHQ